MGARRGGVEGRGHDALGTSAALSRSSRRPPASTRGPDAGERPVERARLGIDQQLGRIEAVSVSGAQGPCAQAVACARRDARRHARGRRRRYDRSARMRSVSASPVASNRHRSAAVAWAERWRRWRRLDPVSPRGSDARRRRATSAERGRRESRDKSQRNARPAAPRRRPWPSRVRCMQRPGGRGSPEGGVRSMAADRCRGGRARTDAGGQPGPAPSHWHR